MRVRSPNGARLSVEQEAHCTLFARALGVEIDEDDLLAYLLHVSVGNNEGVIRVRIERKMSHKVHNAHVAKARFINVYAASWALRRTVCRAQDLAPLVKIRTQLGARPCVVAERDDVRPGVQYGVRLARSYADNVCVFAVYDDKIKLKLLAQTAQIFSKIIQPRLSAHVADGKNFYTHKKILLSWSNECSIAQITVQ